MPAQLTLGDLIKELKRFDPSYEIEFDFCHYRPGIFTSYRGYYDELAISPEENSTKLVSEFLKQCENCVGRTFQGYKGGDYIMNLNTRIWVADYGVTTGTFISDIRKDKYDLVIIETSYKYED